MKILTEPTLYELNYNSYQELIIIEKIDVLNHYFIFRTLEQVSFLINNDNSIQSSKILFDYEIDFIKNNLKFIQI